MDHRLASDPGLESTGTSPDLSDEDGRFVVSYDLSSLTAAELARAIWQQLAPGSRRPAFYYLAWLCVMAIGGAFFGFLIGIALIPIEYLSGRAVLATALSAMLGIVYIPSLLLLRTFARLGHTLRTVRTQGRRVIAISPEGLTVRVDSGASSHAWAPGQRFFTTRRDLVLHITNFRLLCVIPRRLFDPPEAADDFLEACRRWHAATQPIVKEPLPFD